MDTLPDELILHIASFLDDTLDQASFARVSRRIRNVLRDPTLRKLNEGRLWNRLYLGRPVEPFVLESVNALKLQASMDISGVLDAATNPLCLVESVELAGAPDEVNWSRLARIPKLRSLALKSAMLRSDGDVHTTGLARLDLVAFSADAESPTTHLILPALQNMTMLQQLHLHNASTWSDYELDALRHLANLRSLTLQNCSNLNAAGVSSIASLKQLTELNLANSFVDDASMAQLANHPSLTRIGLGGCEGVGRVTSRALSTITTLSEIDLSSCFRIDDRAVADLATLPRLKSLKLRKCSRLTDVSLLHLSACELLEHLDLRFCTDITDEGVTLIANLPLLVNLYLCGCSQLTDRSITVLAASCTNLRELDVARLPLLTQSGVEQLQRLNLNKLFIGDCLQITEDALEAVSHIRTLNELSLSSSRHLGNGAIAHLRNCFALRRLDVSHCNRISFLETIRMLSHIPDLVVVKLG